MLIRKKEKKNNVLDCLKGLSRQSNIQNLGQIHESAQNEVIHTPTQLGGVLKTVRIALDPLTIMKRFLPLQHMALDSYRTYLL